MEIKINGITHEYTPSPSGWHQKSEDYFKYPVRIGEDDVFIKRFTNLPSAFELLKNFEDGVNIAGMPTIYAMRYSDKEQQYFLFQECIRGKELILGMNGVLYFDLNDYAARMFNVFEFLRLQNHWYTDFTEENILVDKDRKFYLIDIDSCSPLYVIARTGTIKSENFSSGMLHKLRQLRPSFKYGDIDGYQINILQLIFSIIHFYHFTHYRERDSYSNFNKTKTRDQLSTLVPFIDEKLLKALEQPLTYKDIEDILEHFAAREGTKVLLTNQPNDENFTKDSGIKGTTVLADDIPTKNEVEDAASTKEEVVEPVSKVPLFIDVFADDISVKDKVADNVSTEDEGYIPETPLSIGFVADGLPVENEAEDDVSTEEEPVENIPEAPPISSAVDNPLDENEIEDGTSDKKRIGGNIIEHLPPPPPPPKEPIVQALEVNSQKRERFRFKPGTKYTLSWITRNANYVELDGKILNETVGTKKLIAEQTRVHKLVAIHEDNYAELRSEPKQLYIIITQPTATSPASNPIVPPPKETALIAEDSVELVADEFPLLPDMEKLQTEPDELTPPMVTETSALLEPQIPIFTINNSTAPLLTVQSNTLLRIDWTTKQTKKIKLYNNGVQVPIGGKSYQKDHCYIREKNNANGAKSVEIKFIALSEEGAQTEIIRHLLILQNKRSWGGVILVIVLFLFILSLILFTQLNF